MCINIVDVDFYGDCKYSVDFVLFFYSLKKFQFFTVSKLLNTKPKNSIENWKYLMEKVHLILYSNSAVMRTANNEQKEEKNVYGIAKQKEKVN